jgi:hypothetical protein
MPLKQVASTVESIDKAEIATKHDNMPFNPAEKALFGW